MGDRGQLSFFRSLGIGQDELGGLLEDTERFIPRVAKAITERTGAGRLRAERAAFDRSGPMLDPVLERLAKGERSPLALRPQEVESLEKLKINFQAIGLGIMKGFAGAITMARIVANGFNSRPIVEEARANERARREGSNQALYEQAGAESLPGLYTPEESYGVARERAGKFIYRPRSRRERHVPPPARCGRPRSNSCPPAAT